MQASDTETRSVGSRAACYRLFSAAFCLPSEEFFTSDDLREFAKLLSELGSGASDAMANMAEARELVSVDELKIEYTRLFVGPFALPAPPYGSVYLDDGRRLMGDSTIDAVRRYREVGIEMDPVQHDVPDHIAVELEFMAYLLHLEQVAAADDDAVEKALERQESFLEKHLCAWVPIFAEKVEQDTESAFYHELVGAVSLFVVEDLERVRTGRNGV